MTGSGVGRGVILLFAALVIIGLVNLLAPDQVGTEVVPPAATFPVLAPAGTS